MWLDRRIAPDCEFSYLQKIVVVAKIVCIICSTSVKIYISRNIIMVQMRVKIIGILEIVTSFRTKAGNFEYQTHLSAIVSSIELLLQIASALE